MLVTQFERLDLDHKFEQMMQIAALDSMWIDWIKMSREVFGPWAIEAHPAFAARWGTYLYEEIANEAEFKQRICEWVPILKETLERCHNI